MIEAVNATVANASVLQSTAGRATAQPSLNQVSSEEVLVAPTAPKAPYISPYISMNYDYDKAVVQIRDSDTGEVQNQFPTESRMAAQQRAQALQEQQSQATRQRSAEVNSAPRAETAQSTSAPSSSSDVVTVQDLTSTPASNAPRQTPQQASAALNAATQTAAAQAAQSTISVSV